VVEIREFTSDAYDETGARKVEPYEGFPAETIVAGWSSSGYDNALQAARAKLAEIAYKMRPALT
jgi:hypothetical protein